jgi:DNA segregation ATPase FtsK/SpoIIIE-like protein
MPWIVIVIDELANLMTVATGSRVAACRLAQMARAAGIHLW